MKKTILKYLSTKWPAILWSAIIFLLLAVRSPKLPEEKLIFIPHLDKFVHAFLFFVFVFLWGSYFAERKNNSSQKNKLVLLAITGTVYGILMEYIQLYTGRDFDIWDMVADGVGAFLCLLLWQKISPGRNRGRNQN